jgi:hypothetical protein
LGCFFGFLASLAVNFSSNVNLKVISASICGLLTELSSFLYLG